MHSSAKSTTQRPRRRGVWRRSAAALPPTGTGMSIGLGLRAYPPSTGVRALQSVRCDRRQVPLHHRTSLSSALHESSPPSGALKAGVCTRLTAKVPLSALGGGEGRGEVGETPVPNQRRHPPHPRGAGASGPSLSPRKRAERAKARDKTAGAAPTRCCAARRRGR